MKIELNYDLLVKLAEANKGFSLVRLSKRILGYGTTSSVLISLMNLLSSADATEYLADIALVYSIHALSNGIAYFSVSNRIKDLAIQDTDILVSQLNCMGVNTNQEKLLTSYKYNTEYEILRSEDSIVPSVLEKKYIMVPAYDGCEETEVSLVQEHIVGSNKYTLSHGEPKKVHKLVLNRGSI